MPNFWSRRETKSWATFFSRAKKKVGQLGCGDTTNRKDPRTVQLNSRVRSMHLGVYHTYAVLENDTVKCGSGTRMGILATARKRT